MHYFSGVSVEGPGGRDLYSTNSDWTATLCTYGVSPRYSILAYVLCGMYARCSNVHGFRILDIKLVRTRRYVLMNTAQVPFLRNVHTATYLHGLNSRIEVGISRSDRRSLTVRYCVKTVR